MIHGRSVTSGGSDWTASVTEHLFVLLLSGLHQPVVEQRLIRCLRLVCSWSSHEFLLERLSLPHEFICSILEDSVALLESPEFDFDHLEHLARVVEFTLLLVPVDWPLEQITQPRHQLTHYFVSSAGCFFHVLVLLFKLINLALVIIILLLLHDLLLLAHIVVLVEKPLRLVMNKVAEHFEGVLLLDLLAFKQFSHLGDPVPDFLHLLHFLVDLLLE